jgi:hypothetical protein
MFLVKANWIIIQAISPVTMMLLRACICSGPTDTPFRSVREITPRLLARMRFELGPAGGE